MQINFILFKVYIEPYRKWSNLKVKHDKPKKEYIIDYINTLGGKKIYKLDEPIPPKSILCEHLDLMFRYKDITDKSKRYFLGIEETLEYKLND